MITALHSGRAPPNAAPDPCCIANLLEQDELQTVLRGPLSRRDPNWTSISLRHDFRHDAKGPFHALRPTALWLYNPYMMLLPARTSSQPRKSKLFRWPHDRDPR
jgi:hypothetical protein